MSTTQMMCARCLIPEHFVPLCHSETFRVSRISFLRVHIVQSIGRWVSSNTAPNAGLFLSHSSPCPPRAILQRATKGHRDKDVTTQNATLCLASTHRMSHCTLHVSLLHPCMNHSPHVAPAKIPDCHVAAIPARSSIVLHYHAYNDHEFPYESHRSPCDLPSLRSFFRGCPAV